MTKQKGARPGRAAEKDISGWSADLFGELTAAPTVFTGYDTLTDTGVVVALSDEGDPDRRHRHRRPGQGGRPRRPGQDPLLRRDGRPDRRPRRPDRRQLHPACADVKKTPKGYFVHTCVLGKRLCPGGRHPDRPGGQGIPLGHRPQPHRHPPAAGGPAGRCWATMSTRQVRTRTPM